VIEWRTASSLYTARNYVLSPPGPHRPEGFRDLSWHHAVRLDRRSGQLIRRDDAFVEAGGNSIDTADVYSNWVEGNPGGVAEEIIGRWMHEHRNRHQIVLAIKVRGRMWEGPNGKG
jgi:aryl-alcohol dehydrogenase-like predicted oxidoreductase